MHDERGLGKPGWTARLKAGGVYLQGLELVPQLQSGDTIVSAAIVEGAERLVRPA